MRRLSVRPMPLLLAVLVAVCCSSCQGGKRYYAVRGKVFANGKPAEGVTIVFHSPDPSDPQAVQPSAIVQADGSFELRTFIVEERVLKDGAPAGQYQVTCIWYPADLQNYLGRENLPDKLKGKYADPKKSGLKAEIPEKATQLPPFELEIPK